MWCLEPNLVPYKTSGGDKRARWGYRRPLLAPPEPPKPCPDPPNPPKPLHRPPLTPLTPPLAPLTTRKCKNAPKWKTAQNWQKWPKMAQKWKTIKNKIGLWSPPMMFSDQKIWTPPKNGPKTARKWPKMRNRPKVGQKWDNFLGPQLLICTSTFPNFYQHLGQFVYICIVA